MFQQFVEKIKTKLDKDKSSPINNEGDDKQSTSAPVVVHVYDMFWINEYINGLGIGVYHTGVEIYGTEYCYGGHPFEFSGIFPMVPKDSEELGENYTFKTSIQIGVTDFRDDDIKQLIESMGQDYRGDQYHLLSKNCNHFSQALVEILCGSSLPKWVNRLATVSARIPFIERAIPKEWLTPLGQSEEQQQEVLLAYHQHQFLGSASSPLPVEVVEGDVNGCCPRSLHSLNSSLCSATATYTYEKPDVQKSTVQSSYEITANASNSTDQSSNHKHNSKNSGASFGFCNLHELK